MTTAPKQRRWRWLFIPPVVVGVAIVMWMRGTDRPLKRIPPAESVRTLRVIPARAIAVVPRVTGYGTAQPAQVWRAVAEVQGHVTEVSPGLRPGAFIRQGDIVLRIDRREYDLVLSRVDAEIAEINAQLSELVTQQQNDQAALAIEEAALELARADRERIRSLGDRDMAAAIEQRASERSYLAQQQKVQTLTNALALLPRRQETLQAGLAVRQAHREQAGLDIDKTVLRAPFDCRIGPVSIEPGQFLRAGETLFEADGAAATEIDVQVAIDRAQHLVRRDNAVPLGGLPDMDTLRERFAVEATVRLRLGDAAATWPARFVRIREQIDPVTRTAAIVVAVDRPYDSVIPGRRPPLVRGMFCEVELRAEAWPPHIIVPRVAVHEGAVYVVDAEGRLARREVSVLFEQGDFAVLGDGLQGNEPIIVSDPTPAIVGQRVVAVVDDVLAARLVAQAADPTEVAP